MREGGREGGRERTYRGLTRKETSSSGRMATSVSMADERRRSQCWRSAWKGGGEGGREGGRGSGRDECRTGRRGWGREGGREGGRARTWSAAQTVQ